jgi:hypothetical protein
MSLHHSPATHQSLLARIPEVTGRNLSQWFEALENGPGLCRFDEQVNWLRDEHELSHGYAVAIVHEHHRRRAATRG